MYAFFFEWPKNGTLSLAGPKMSVGSANVSLVGGSGSDQFRFKPKSGQKGVDIFFPAIPVSRLPSLFLWGLKLMGVEN